ncbi:WS/DGAT domain-containing protein [Nocardia sp. CA-120079]|uniref:WS/DGAT domain-containing protein n=1 Tax=Nocardia sp. CA-120079 TaxID=3239974 RepID=UPI003D96BF8F
MRYVERVGARRGNTVSRPKRRKHLIAHVPPTFNLIVSNVPGPDRPLYLAGARMVEMYPLSLAQAGRIGVSCGYDTYDGFDRPTLGSGFTRPKGRRNEPRR